MLPGKIIIIRRSISQIYSFPSIGIKNNTQIKTFHRLRHVWYRRKKCEWWSRKNCLFPSVFRDV